MRFDKREKGEMSAYFAKEKEINLAYSESQNMYRRLIESVRSGIYMADEKGNLFYVNHAFVEILGYDVLGLNLIEELYSQPKEGESFLEKMKETGFLRDYEIEYKRKDGTAVILSTTSNYIWNDKGDIIGIEGVVHDITEKTKLEEELLIEKQKLEQILGFDEKIGSIRKFDALIDYIVDKTCNILEAQRCSLMLLDEVAQELCIQGAKGLNDEIIKKTRIKYGEPIAGIVAKEQHPLLITNIEYDQRFKRANRPTYSGRSFMIAPIRLEDKLIGVINVADRRSKSNREVPFNEISLKILCAIAREVAVAIENVKLYKELSYLTITDPLTRIYNYRQFSKSLNYEIKRINRVGGRLCLIMMDIDDFKSYNDTFGHLEGDALLKGLGQILKTGLRETDIVCRYAGDEFAIILPDVDTDGAKKAAEKIKRAVEKHAFKRKVTLSIGIANYSTKLTQYEFILKADRALYQAKYKGKNNISVYK
jgi:diguanylate cyclase (GGDEF)-like protein/PAS domain S-box-containing protein